MVRYTYSTSAHAIGTATAMVRDGGKKWYFVTADYAFGHSLEKASANVVKAQGGEVLGAVRHPRSEEHTSELQSLMRISYAVFCLKKKNNANHAYKHTYLVIDTVQ